ncbi:MAG: tRNA/rRNA methyltransferase, partial [Candidatus Amesbacteria bacterium GW2011_GWC2_47_8]
MKLNAKQLRVTKPSEKELARIERKPIYIVLDNVLDTYNIGSIFRLADAVAAKEIILCGGSETPPSSRIHKAAVGTEEWVPWRYAPKADEVIKRLRD